MREKPNLVLMSKNQNILNVSVKADMVTCVYCAIQFIRLHWAIFLVSIHISQYVGGRF